MKSFWFLLLTISLPCGAAWTPVNAKANKECDSSQPCFLTQEKLKSSYKIVVETQSLKKQKQIDKVKISTDQNSREYKDFKNFPKLFKQEGYEFFSTDLNGDGFLDLALKASRSIRQGYFYFYWVFDSKNKVFKLTPKQLPKLTLKSSKLLSAQGSSEKFKVGPDFEIKPLKSN